MTALPLPPLPAHIAAAHDRHRSIRIGADRAPSLEPMIQLVAADLNHVNAVILERMQSDVALIPELAGHLIAGGGKRMRPMLTLACAAAARLSGHAPPQARRRGRVHPHRDPAPRRRRRRLGPEARQAHRQHHLGQSGERAGRRLPVLAQLRADGRGRQPQGAQDPVARVERDRRGRGQPADRAAPDRDQRGPVSRDHRGQDRGPVRRRLPDRGGGRRARARRRSRRSTPMAATSASPSSWSTTRSTMPPTPRRWARASATISATAR